MAKTDSLQGSIDLLVLKILSRRRGPHGYAIMSAIKDWSGDVLRADEGSLYRRCTGWRKQAGFGPNGSRKTRGVACASID
jgi:hypothetical protein